MHRQNRKENNNLIVLNCTSNVNSIKGAFTLYFDVAIRKNSFLIFKMQSYVLENLCTLLLQS